MIELIQNKVQIQTDGRTVWVNNSEGYCIGRFGKMGIDIHQQFQQTECLFCTHQPTTLKDWSAFKTKMEEFYQVKIPEEMRPNFL